MEKNTDNDRKHLSGIINYMIFLISNDPGMKCSDFVEAVEGKIISMTSNGHEVTGDDLAYLAEQLENIKSFFADYKIVINYDLKLEIAEI